MGKKFKCDNCTKMIRKRYEITENGKKMKVCRACKERKEGKN